MHFYNRNSKKINRTILNVVFGIIAIALFCGWIFIDLTEARADMFVHCLSLFVPVYIIIVRMFQDSEKEDDKDPLPNVPVTIETKPEEAK